MNKHRKPMKHFDEIKKLRETVKDGDIKVLSRETELFRGADIIISDDPQCPDSNGLSDYVKVVTPHARELSWIIFQLKEIFSSELDYMNKFYFYPALAEAAKSYIEQAGNDMSGLLMAVLDKAETIEL